MYALYLGADNNGERKDQSGWSEVQLRKTKKRGGGVFACEQMGGQYTCMIDSHYIFCNATPFSMCA